MRVSGSSALAGFPPLVHRCTGEAVQVPRWSSGGAAEEYPQLRESRRPLERRSQRRKEVTRPGRKTGDFPTTAIRGRDCAYAMMLSCRLRRAGFAAQASPLIISGPLDRRRLDPPLQASADGPGILVQIHDSHRRPPQPQRARGYRSPPPREARELPLAG